MLLRFVLIAAFFGVAVLWPAVATSSEEVSEEKPLSARWITGLTFDVMLHTWEAEASVDSPMSSLNVSQSSEFDAVQYQVGAELLTPRMNFLPAAPRFWVYGGALVSPQETHSIAQTGDFIPAEPEARYDRWSGPARGFDPDPRYLPYLYIPDLSAEFPGQASRVKARYLEGGWYVGLGMVFELPYRESMIRLKPFVGYLRQRVEISGEVAGVYPDANTPPVEPPPPPYTSYPYTLFRATAPWKKQTEHFLGPGGEIELVLIPGSSLAFSIFGQAQFLWNLERETVFLEAENSVPTPGIPARIARFTYTPDSFVVRGVLGARLAWRGGFSF